MTALRLARLRRLERIRAMARLAAAQEAARAEGTLAQFEALAARTGVLAADYAMRDGGGDGATLAQIGRFAAELRQMHVTTLGDAARARDAADARLVELAAAERRRAAVEEYALGEERRLARKDVLAPVGSRRVSGTGLE